MEKGVMASGNYGTLLTLPLRLLPLILPSVIRLSYLLLVVDARYT